MHIYRYIHIYTCRQSARSKGLRQTEETCRQQTVLLHSVRVINSLIRFGKAFPHTFTHSFTHDLPSFIHWSLFPSLFPSMLPSLSYSSIIHSSRFRSLCSFRYSFVPSSIYQSISSSIPCHFNSPWHFMPFHSLLRLISSGRGDGVPYPREGSRDNFGCLVCLR